MDYESDSLPKEIAMRRLGIEESDCEFWASGHSFSEGFEFYGTVFRDAIDRKVQDKAYLGAMKRLYGIELPECQAMVGCSSEH